MMAHPVLARVVGKGATETAGMICPICSLSPDDYQNLNRTLRPSPQSSR